MGNANLAGGQTKEGTEAPTERVAPGDAGSVPQSPPALASGTTGKAFDVPFGPSGISGSNDSVFSERLGNQVVRCLALPDDMPADRRRKRATAALQSMREIAPRNGLEGMLAAHMAALHAAGLNLLARGMHGKQRTEVDMHLRHGGRLLELFTRQRDALQRQRGRERETLRVEHEQRSEDGRTSVTAESQRVR